MVNHSSSLIGLISLELRNLLTFFTYATALQLLVSYVVLNVCMYKHASDMYRHASVFTHCMYLYTNTVSTSILSSGATPTVQDVTASPNEHCKQGISV